MAASAGAAGAGIDPLAGQQEERALLEQLARALKAVSGSALTASIRSGSVGMILAVPAKQLEDPTLQRLADALAGRHATRPARPRTGSADRPGRQSGGGDMEHRRGAPEGFLARSGGGH